MVKKRPKANAAPDPNPTNILQAYSHKLHVCEYKSSLKSLVATSVVKFNQLMLVSESTLHLKAKTSLS